MVVFLAKAGRRHFFRAVNLDESGGAIDGDLLNSLQRARCGFNAERDYPEALRPKVYAAWERVRLSIFATLQELRDPARREIVLPKAQRDAIENVDHLPTASPPRRLKFSRAYGRRTSGERYGKY